MTQMTETITFNSTQAEFTQIKDLFKSLVKQQRTTKQAFKQAQRDGNISLISELRYSINSNTLLFYMYLKMKYAKDVFADKVQKSFSEELSKKLDNDMLYIINRYLKYYQYEDFDKKYAHGFVPQMLTFLNLLNQFKLLDTLKDTV